MANYSTLKSAIQEVIKANGNNEITGNILQQSLLAMINSLGSGYQFMGVANPTTNPGTPDQRICYICGAGIYPNFSNIEVEKGKLAILRYDSSWHKESLNIPTSVFNVNYYNDTSQAYATMAAAHGAVPSDMRSLGLTITYKLADGWITEQYIGADIANWSTISNWKRLNKIINIAKWGSADSPTDLNIGDLYTTNGRNLFRVDAIENEQVTSYTTLQLDTNAIYILNGEIYIYNGTILIKDNRVVVLQNISTFSESGITETGQYYFNTSNNRIYRCNRFNTSIEDSIFAEMPSLKNINTLYLCKGALYYYNGVNLSPFIPDTMNEILDTPINIATLIENNTWYTGQTIGDTIVRTTYNGCKAVKIAVSQGETYKFTAKGSTGGRGWYLLDSTDKIVQLADANFNDTIILTIPSGVSYLLIQSNSSSVTLALSIPGDFSEVQAQVNDLNSRVAELEISAIPIEAFKCDTPFLWNKLARLKTLDAGFCNIGFIGDSWTQGTEDYIGGIAQGDYQGYIKPLSELLQNEYGFGGLGWFDFACDGGDITRKMFGCAKMWDNISYSFTGTVTGLDGNDSAQAPNCLGICCAHIIFSNNATLLLNFGAGLLDRFKVRYYKSAHFNISINGGAPVEITANSTDGWQETEIGTTGTDITSVLITSLADNTIIFGLDCFYGTKGVRCHKIGNRSIAASDYLLMNAAQWETGIKLLELSWASVMLAINDLGSSTSETKMNTIVTNINNLIERLKVAANNGNGLVTCDINLLGIENIENANYTGLGQLAAKERAFAIANNYGWASTEKCIGKTKAEIIYNGTFSDGIHLNKIGSYAYAKHIYDNLFQF